MTCKAGLQINTQYPRSSLKRWSTRKLTEFIDVSSPWSYTARLKKIKGKHQSTLNQWCSKKVPSGVAPPSTRNDLLVTEPMMKPENMNGVAACPQQVS